MPTPPALESARQLYKAHIRTGEKPPEIAGRFAKKPGGGDPENSAAVAGAVLRIVGRLALGINTLVLRYSLDAAKANDQQSLPCFLCAGPVYRNLIQNVSLYQPTCPFTSGKKAESPGVASYTVFWMNRIIRSWQVFPLIPQCGHIVGLSE